jgi:hypothetical protein
MDFAGALSPALAQAGYLFPNTPMAIEQLFHLRSDSTARPFDISFSPDPTSFHHCPYTTIGADINITGPPPTPNTYQDDAENILNKITANADNNLQQHERGKLGRMHKPSTPNTPFIHGDQVIGELYRKNMVLIPFTIDPWARFGPMLQSCHILYICCLLLRVPSSPPLYLMKYRESCPYCYNWRSRKRTPTE